MFCSLFLFLLFLLLLCFDPGSNIASPGHSSVVSRARNPTPPTPPPKPTRTRLHHTSIRTAPAALLPADRRAGGRMARAPVPISERTHASHHAPR